MLSPFRFYFLWWSPNFLSSCSLLLDDRGIQRHPYIGMGNAQNGTTDRSSDHVVVAPVVHPPALSL